MAELMRFQARWVIKAYRLDPGRWYFHPPEVEAEYLDPVEKDPQGNVTKALHLIFPEELRRMRSSKEILGLSCWVIANLMAAVDLSRYAAQAIEASDAEGRFFAAGAAMQRWYWEKFQGRVPLEFVGYAKEMEAWHEEHVRRRTKLPDAIKRTRSTPTAPELIAIRDFRDRLREGRIRTTTRGHSSARGSGLGQAYQRGHGL